MASEGASTAGSSSSSDAKTNAACPVCAYDFSSFRREPVVCPECGKDPAEEWAAIQEWHRGARWWALGVGLVVSLCVLSTLLCGDGAAIARAVACEGIVGVLAVGLMVGWSGVLTGRASVPNASVFTGAVARVVAPIVVCPVVLTAIWVWYFPLTRAIASGGWSHYEATSLLERLTLVAMGLCALTWASAVYSGLRKTHSMGQFVGCTLGLVSATAGAAMLAGIAAFASMVTLFGGDGQGP